MKRFLALLLAAIFAVTPLFGCYTEPPETPSASTEKEESEPGNEKYEYFWERAEENEYDKWLADELAVGVRSEYVIYAEYLALWKNELTFSINGAKLIFDHHEYDQWAAALSEWLTASEYVRKIEMNAVVGTDTQLEVIIPHCKLVRQKVLDTKYFIYVRRHQEYMESHPSLDIEIKVPWATDKSTVQEILEGEKSPKLYHIPEVFMPVIKSEKTFKINGEHILLSEYVTEQGYKFQPKYFVKIDEMNLILIDLAAPESRCLTLKEYDGVIFGYASNEVDYSSISVENILSKYLESLDANLEKLQELFVKDNYLTFCNFINDRVGYFFVAVEEELHLMFKTEDGGESWVSQDIENFSSRAHWKEKALHAEMMDENVGFFTNRFHAGDESLGDRVYLTLDGGRNWHALDQSYFTEKHQSYEACDFSYEDGKYIMYLRTPYHYEDQKYVKYYSEDLTVWTEIKNEKYLKYSDVIETVDELLSGKSEEEFCLPDNEFDKAIYAAARHSTQTWRSGFLGYAQKDINGDGSDELLILDDLGTVFAIFTLTDKGIRVVDEFVTLGTANSPVCLLDPNGNIYLSMYGRGGSGYYKVCRLSEDGVLEDVYGLRIFSDIDDTETKCYKLAEGKQIVIDRDEYNRLYDEYDFKEIFNSSTSAYNNIKRIDLEFCCFPNHPDERK